MRTDAPLRRRSIAWTPLAGVLLALAPATASAAVITPDVTTDDFGGDLSHCSLREAVQAAQTNGVFGGCSAANNDADTIVLTAGQIYSLTIPDAGDDNTNANGDLDILAAPGSDEILTIQSSVDQTKATIDANGDGSIDDPANVGDRVIDVAPDGSLGTDTFTTLHLTDIALTDGNEDTAAGAAALFARGNSGTLTLDRVRLFANKGDPAGGAAALRFGSFPPGEGTISDTRIDSNPVRGISQDFGTLNVSTSTISDNSSASPGAGIAVRSPGTTLTLSNSTVSGNLSELDGGGISLQQATVNLRSTTVTNNTADLPGGTAGDGGGLKVDSGTVNSQNSIIAGNFDLSGGAPDCSAAASGFVSGGYNLIGSAQGCTWTQNNDLFGIGANLGPLASNGGPTQTHLLLTGSPALNSGNPATPTGSGSTCQASDQLGNARPFVGPGDDRCDIGAVEMQEGDSDNDKQFDGQDNCPSDPNPTQANNDGDAQGDACDPDDDNDNVSDASDNCPTVAGTAANAGCPATTGGGTTPGGTGPGGANPGTPQPSTKKCKKKKKKKRSAVAAKKCKKKK
jgi:CSLREA domain-containing protein